MNNQLPLIWKITEIIAYTCGIVLQFIREWVWCEPSHLVVIDTEKGPCRVF